MSIAVTVAQLQERARVLTDIPTYDTDTHVTSAMALDFVKLAAQKLAGLVQSAGASEHFLTSYTTLATVANVATVALTTGTMDLVRIALQLDANGEVMLEPASLDEWDPTPGLWTTTYLPRYRVMGDTLRLFPTPTEVRTLRVYYTGGFVVTSTSDSLALRECWDEYIVNHVCVLIRNRQNKDAAEFRLERDMNAEEIRAQLRRDRAGARQVRDLRGDWGTVYARRGRGWWQ